MPATTRSVPLTLDQLRLESEQRQLRVALWLLLLLPIIFGSAEAVLGDQPARVQGVLVILRVGLLASLLGLIEWIGRLRTRAMYTRAVTWTLSLGVVVVLTLHRLGDRSVLVPFLIELLVVLALYAFIPNEGFRQARIAGGLTLGSLALLYGWHDGTTLPERVVITTTFLVANALGIAFIWHRRERERREEAIFAREQEAREELERTLAELRVLRGILPICSHCRMIRATEGDWHPLESYVRAHSEADFSHGICPDCLERHYDDDLYEETIVGL